MLSSSIIDLWKGPVLLNYEQSILNKIEKMSSIGSRKFDKGRRIGLQVSLRLVSVPKDYIFFNGLTVNSGFNNQANSIVSFVFVEFFNW